ncbi:MAG: hypothetical protein WC859_01950 [Elusimicrobiota bacterium]|jgi:hypothetical protein
MQKRITESVKRSSSGTLFGMLVFAGSFLFRIMVYLRYVADHPGLPFAPNAFPGVLASHFREYVLFNDCIPPLTYVIQKVLLSAAGLRVAGQYHVHLLYLFLADSIAVTLLYRVMDKVSVNRWVALALALAYSFALIVFELWYAGLMGHYDVYTTFFNCLFIFCLASWIEARTWTATLGFSAACGLLMLQLNVTSYSVPVLLMVQAAWLLFRREFRQARLFQWLTITGCVMLLVGVLSLRAFRRTGSFSVSPKGGAASMMFVQRALGWSDFYENNPPALPVIQKFLMDSGAPDWYRWCYDHAIPPTGPDGKPSNGWTFLSHAFGICMPWSSAHGVADRPWPFDFGPLASRLDRFGQPRLAAIIRKDQEDSYARQYLFQGYSPELSPRWIGVYAGESLRLTRALFMSRPLLYLRTMKAVHEEYATGGPEFLHGLRPENADAYFLHRYVEILSHNFFPWLMKTAYSVFLWGGLLIIIRWWRWREEAATNVYGILVVQVVFFSVVFSGLVTVENPRYFMFSIPALLVMLGLVLQTSVVLFVEFFRYILQLRRARA